MFIENFRVGVVERLGLGYQVLAERNPRLVYCSISGFGPHGPLALLPSVDPYIQAFSGFASLNGRSRQSGREFTHIGFIDLNTSALTDQRFSPPWWRASRPAWVNISWLPCLRRQSRCK